MGHRAWHLVIFYKMRVKWEGLRGVMRVSHRSSTKCGAISAQGSTLVQYKAKVEGAMGSSLSLGLSAGSLNARAGPLNARAGPQGRSQGASQSVPQGPEWEAIVLQRES